MILPLLNAFLPKLIFIKRSGSVTLHITHITTVPKVIVKQLANIRHIFRQIQKRLLPGNFVAYADDDTMKKFRSSYGLHSPNKQPTCYEHSEISSYIDLILKNNTKSFQSACALEKGSSDCYRMTVFVMKIHFRKLPQVISYRGFKNFENERFMNSL